MADADFPDGSRTAGPAGDVAELPGPRTAADDDGRPPFVVGGSVSDLRPVVCWTVAVGWTMTTLWRTLAPASGRAVDPDHLPGEVELRPAEAARRHLERIRVALLHLRDVLPDSSVVGPAPDVLVTRLQAALSVPDPQSGERAPDPKAARDLVRELHVRVLSGLSASDIRFGKAYDLGTSLADLALVVGDEAEQAGTAAADAAVPTSGRAGPTPRGARRWLGHGRRARSGTTAEIWPLDELLRLHDNVRDLATVLPEHAGAPIRESLAFWRAYLDGWASAAGRRHLEAPEVLLLLQRQIHVWKALLLGEKAAVDSLTLPQYLSAGLCTVRRIQREVARVVRAAWPVLTLLVFAVAGVIAAAVVYASGTAVSTTVFAAVTTGLGAAWRSTRAPLVRVLDRYSDSLRDAEIDAAIARAISILPADAPWEQIERTARLQVAVPHRRRESHRTSPRPRTDAAPSTAVGAAGNG
jgi:hypothetical protein